ncbi:hypothetical protein BDN70DRAFT_869092 [Pholiota conissans]|uniref:DUF6589 domain-containing protein n=1 Tax=Pholiota conissans TaxID=109636 RepID=A0A9P5YKR1_9AGAR|nr:hypothetical protein BDN70DRAFT_869092 [Pholiota conissans]
MGLFHLKMACADAVWRLLIHPKDARLDPNSFMEHIGQIRPKETFKIEKKPGFRRMHEVIQHVGIVSRLDIWRIEATKRSAAFTDIEEFAKSKPTFEDLCMMANLMAINYVASDDLHDLQEKSSQHRDKEYENSLIKQQYFLLYEEISHAMNFGDIGRVETCFLPWMLIFAGCGKHKYATEMRRYLENVHFLYPEGIRCISMLHEYFIRINIALCSRKAIRMNILCNPTGKKGHFRALDWVVEHNNLYIKRIYGGKYSNHQKERIIAESPLIETYKNVRMQFEHMFCLEHKTSRHSPPKMELTFKRLMQYMKDNNTNSFVPGRDSAYCIPDTMDKGIDIMRLREGQVESDLQLGGDDELGDEMEEVEDDGSLDV